MARRKNSARSAPLPALVPGTGPDHDSPAAAIYAALTAHPGGATAAIIADAAGIGRPAARDALAAMEAAGAVTRTKGGKPGVPDIWTSAIGLPQARAGQIAQQPAGGPADAATPDPAVVTEITRRIEQILAAASAAGVVLAGSGNMSAVRAGLDEIWEQAAQARRALKVAGSLTPASAPRAPTVSAAASVAPPAAVSRLSE